MPLSDFNLKRILLAIVLVLMSIGMLIGLIWILFFRTTGTTEDTGPTSEVTVSEGLPGAGSQGQANIVGTSGTLPGINSISVFETGEDVGGYSSQSPSIIARGTYTQVSAVVEDDVQSLNMEGDTLSYLSEDDGKFYRLSIDGETATLLSDKEFDYVESVEWSADGNKVVLEYPDGANIIYDFTKNKAITLPTGLTEPSFDSTADELAYKFIGSTSDDNWLVVSESNNTNAVAIEPLGDNYDSVQVTWSPNKEVVALYHKSIGLNKEEIFFVGLEGENYKSVAVAGSNFQGAWSKDGKRILYHVISSDNNYNPSLWIVDAQGDNIGNNNFSLGLTTWVDKCTFSNDNVAVYCAVPVNLPEGSGLYPDYLNDSKDVFYEINLNTGISKLIAYPVLSDNLDEFRVSKLVISDDNSKLFFLDDITQKIYSMRLK